MPDVLGTGRQRKLYASDRMLQAETKKVFREFMILNGLDPETMSREGSDPLI